MYAPKFTSSSVICMFIPRVGLSPINNLYLYYLLANSVIQMSRLCAWRLSQLCRVGVEWLKLSGGRAFQYFSVIGKQLFRKVFHECHVLRN